MSGEQVLEDFKESFPPKPEAQLLEINNIDTAIRKQEFLDDFWNLKSHNWWAYLC